MLLSSIISGLSFLKLSQHFHSMIHLWVLPSWRMLSSTTKHDCRPASTLVWSNKSIDDSIYCSVDQLSRKYQWVWEWRSWQSWEERHFRQEWRIPKKSYKKKIENKINSESDHPIVNHFKQKHQFWIRTNLLNKKLLNAGLRTGGGLDRAGCWMELLDRAADRGGGGWKFWV